VFGLGLPLLIFKQEGIGGGVFDPGVTDVFIHTMPPPKSSPEQLRQLREVFLSWQSKVRDHYYRW
jgi:hypothetical protein